MVSTGQPSPTKRRDLMNPLNTVNLPRFKFGESLVPPSGSRPQVVRLVPRSQSPAPARMLSDLSIEYIRGGFDVARDARAFFCTSHLNLTTRLLTVNVPVTLVFFGDYYQAPDALLRDRTIPPFLPSDRMRYKALFDQAISIAWSRKHKLRSPEGVEVDVEVAITSEVADVAPSVAAIANLRHYPRRNVVGVGLLPAGSGPGSVFSDLLGNSATPRSFCRWEDPYMTLTGPHHQSNEQLRTAYNVFRDVMEGSVYESPGVPTAVASVYSYCRRAGVPQPPALVNTAMTSIRNTVACHEFGHWLGMPDEYPLPPDDFLGETGQLGRVLTMQSCENEAIRIELATRSSFSSSIMNIGSEVLPYHYLPFAWIASAIGEGGRWRILQGTRTRRRP